MPEANFARKIERMKKHLATILIFIMFSLYGVHAQEQDKGCCSRPAFFMSLKTNLLADALAMPSLGAEFALGRKFSVAAQWHYGWWSNPREAFFWQSYGGDLSFRWWFGRQADQKPLTGHHAGPYGQMLTYDFEFGKNGIQAPEWNFAGGVEYGYSLPLAPRLNMDFTIGIGYMGGTFMEYIPKGNQFIWQATKQRNWFGPTKAEISLVWLLGRGNVNSRRHE